MSIRRFHPPNMSEAVNGMYVLHEDHAKLMWEARLDVQKLEKRLEALALAHPGTRMCVTHHHACDCREDMFRTVEDKAETLLERLRQEFMKNQPKESILESMAMLQEAIDARRG